jgi:hypothetical protein
MSNSPKGWLATGEERDYWDNEVVDRLNEEHVYEKQALTPDQVWAHLHQAHQVLLDLLASLPEDAFSLDSYASDTIATESFRHYREQREDLEHFKASHP